MSIIEIEVDLDEYQDDIKRAYCYRDCLLGSSYNTPFEKLKELLSEIYKNLYIYSENKLTVEQVYNDLDTIIKESEID